MSILVEEQNAIPLQESPENYLYFLTTVNPVDFISTSERGSKIVKLFSEHFLPLPFSSNEDGSDLTEETRVILLVPYLISLGTLQIRQDHSPNQPFNMELHQKNRKIQLKQAKEYFCKFLNLVLQYDQVNDDYLSWVLPHTMTRDDEEEQVSKSNKKQDKAFEQLMNDRSQMVLRMRAKNTLEKELFSNIEEMSELEISRLLSSVSLGEDSSKKVSEQVKKKMLNIRDYINFCILDTLEQLSSINREEEMLNAVSARPSMPQYPSQHQQQSSSTSGQPISHLKATSINDVLNNRGMLSQMGYNMILLPNNNGGNTSGNKSTNSGGNSLQKKALANQSIQSNIVNNRATREDIKSRVFGSYVPGPTVSLEEFARQECIDMHQREEKDKQFKQEQTQKKKDDEEEEDEEELKKKRVWDDWKDDHVKGAGNMRD